MIPADSRYQDAVKTFVTSHVYDRYGRPLLSAEDSVPSRLTSTHEATYRLTVPNASATLPPLGYPVRQGESMPFLAWKLMRRHSSWWQIAEANTNVWYPLDIPLGTTLRIPV